MIDDLIIRIADEEDLPEIFRLYSQPDMDNNNVLEPHDAKVIFSKMESYVNLR